MRELTKIRRAKRINQFRLASLSGIPRWRIAYAEAGYLRLTRHELAAIRNALRQAPSRISSREDRQ